MLPRTRPAEGLLVSIIGHDLIIEGLAGKGDLVLGTGQLFAQLHHVLVSLKIGLGLHDDVELTHRPGQGTLGTDQPFESIGIAGI